MKKKIVLFSLENISNTGDEILGATTEWLINRSTSGDIIRAQLTPSIKDTTIAGRIKHVLLKPYLSFIYRTGIYRNGKSLDFYFKSVFNGYFKKMIANADMVILPVGMLKFATQDQSYFFDMITRECQRKGIPVMMSAMSIAKPDKSDWRYHQLVRAVNRECVKVITTRDGKDGLTLLRECYVKNPNIVTDYVGDPALWIPEVYRIAKEFSLGGVIGVNLIRKSIYADYGEQEFSQTQLLNLYKGIIGELEKRGYEWELFCNGMPEDYAVGVELLQTLNLPANKLRRAPKTGVELVHDISNYKAVFGARLHACITSVSLGVPVAGLLWDKKLHCFSKTMGIRQFFSEGEDLQPAIIVDKLEAAMKYNFDINNMDRYKQRTAKFIKNFITHA